MMKSNEEKEAKYDEDSLIILQDYQKALNKFAEKGIMTSLMHLTIWEILFVF